MKATIVAGIGTAMLVLWAHQLDTIGGRVPMVFVALWFGSTTMVATIFASRLVKQPDAATPAGVGVTVPLWRTKIRLAAGALFPFVLVPLLERRGVHNDPAVWLLDAALVISLCTAPYFTLLARTVLGGFALSVGAFQTLWIAGASLCFRIMANSVAAKGGRITGGAAFEEFFRRPEYRYLFFALAAVMLLVYCPTLLWFGRRRFVRQGP